MQTRRLLGAAVATVVALGGGLSAPVQAAPRGGSTVTVRASDYTPKVGQPFVLRGRYTHDGSVAAGQVVRLQSYAAGRWSNIRGAHVTTARDGAYRLRVVLAVRGVRDLRVMGVSDDGRVRAFHRFVVEVH